MNLKPFVNDFNQEEVLNKVEEKFAEILKLLRLEEVVDNVHLDGTPRRVAKMYINELFEGCYHLPPNVKKFHDENATPVINSNITIKSICAHHFVPFYGKASIYYIPQNGLITGLSKFSRVSDYFSRRPQIQENLTRQIGRFFVEELKPLEFIIAIKAKHMCICHRGANEDNPVTETFWSYSKHTGEADFQKIQYVLNTIDYKG